MYFKKFLELVDQRRLQLKQGLLSPFIKTSFLSCIG
jgi:hypothetical protein